MSSEPARWGSSLAGRLRATASMMRESALTVVLVGALVGVIGTAHVLMAPAGHLQPSLLSVLIVLWGLTTLLALGGTYTSIRTYFDTSSQVSLEILPEDELHLLEPILDAPGITQLEVVDRSDYSDAKVSQTLTALRERGLVYRVPQGRTYRLYPGTILDEFVS